MDFMLSKILSIRAILRSRQKTIDLAMHRGRPLLVSLGALGVLGG
jgi:hypothetical protein